MQSKMLIPTVGPIVGHTTSRHARIFLRGDVQEGVMVFAGLRFRRAGEPDWSSPAFIQLTEARDMCEVVTLTELAANTEYEY